MDIEVNIFYTHICNSASVHIACVCVVKWGGRITQLDENPGGGDSTYERGGDARRKFWIKPLRETDLGVAQAFFDP